ncbi:MAG: GTPase Era [Negativicutes bacterium]|nr:GTPase Era [Negativicutes bacterium]
MGGRFRSGFIGIVGRPNVGKSTLVNRLIGQKLAVVSPKPQTTRSRLVGIVNLPDAQVILVDTPGIHQPSHRLGEEMVKTAARAAGEADVVVWLVDGLAAVGEGERKIAGMMRLLSQPVVMAINKIDLAAREDERQLIGREYETMGRFAAVVRLSARRGDNVDRLLKTLVGLLPEGPRYYPEDMLTDAPERVIAGEIVREKALLHLHDEVPHALAVSVDQFRTGSNGTTYVAATVYVERPSQKGIVIGRGGAALKAVGTAARPELEMLLGSKVYLDLRVKVRKDWRQDPASLKTFGYREG